MKAGYLKKPHLIYYWDNKRKEDIRMKIRKRSITGGWWSAGETLYVYPEDVAAFLSQIYELQGLGISLNENTDGSAEFTIGDSVYNIANL